jgi:predicted acetyltransferase
MTVSIRDARNSPGDQQWIQTSYGEYLNDLSGFSMDTGMFPAFNKAGEFADRASDLMAHWFADDSSHPLVIMHNERPVGFALVSRPPVNRRNEIDFRLAEFFVTASARRLGVGANAATLIFSRFAGRWEVIEFLGNTGAVAFWRHVIGKHTSGRFREAMANGEVRHVFQSTRS